MYHYMDYLPTLDKMIKGILYRELHSSNIVVLNKWFLQFQLLKL